MAHGLTKELHTNISKSLELTPIEPIVPSELCPPNDIANLFDDAQWFYELVENEGRRNTKYDEEYAVYEFDKCGLFRETRRIECFTYSNGIILCCGTQILCTKKEVLAYLDSLL